MSNSKQFEYKLIEEKFIKPDLSKYKIPEKLIDKNYGLYYITLQCNDLVKLRKLLYFIPVRLLTFDKTNTVISDSTMIVPEGQATIYYFSSIKNNFNIAIPREDVDQEMLLMRNDDKSDKIVAKPIIYNYQLIGYLLPNSILQEKYIVEEQRNQGVHITYGFKTICNDQRRFYSLIPWKEIEKKLNDQIRFIDLEIKRLKVTEEQYYKERLYEQLYQ